MKETLQIDEAAFAASSQFSSKFAGAAFDKVMIDLQAQVDTAGTNVLALGGAHSLIQSYELRQGQDVLVQVEGRTLRFLAQASEAYAHSLDPATTSQNDEPVKATSVIDMAKLGPLGSLVDAGLGNAEVYQVGRFGALTDGGSGWEAPNGGRTGTLRSSVESVARIPASGYFRPNIISTKLDVGAGPSSKTSYKFEAGGLQGGVLMGFIVETYDASAVAAGVSNAASDALVRKVTVDAITRRYNGNLATRTWGQAKRDAANYLGIKRDAAGLLPPGSAFIPVVDDRAPSALRGGLAMAQGDTIELKFDTKSDVEEEFGAIAGITAATGDQVIITPIFFNRVDAVGAPSTVLAGGAAAPTGVAGRQAQPRRRGGRGRGRR
jgi:hypothetical protein